MRVAFLNDADDIQWLRDTHLRGVTLPAAYAGFASFVLQGNEDAPHAVNLYVSADPLFTDNFFRVRFENDSEAYAEGAEFSGETNEAIGVDNWIVGMPILLAERG